MTTSELNNMGLSGIEDFMTLPMVKEEINNLFRDHRECKIGWVEFNKTLSALLFLKQEMEDKIAYAKHEDYSHADGSWM